MQQREQNQVLKREMKALQSRVETAVAMSNSFEQRLMAVVQEKQQREQEMETQLSHYRRKLHDKRAQNKVLTNALVRLQEQRQSGDSSQESCSSTQRRMRPTDDAKTTGIPSTMLKMSVEKTNKLENVSVERRMRKRELTLPEEIKSAATNLATASKSYKSKKMGASRAETSPTSSSPEISPRSARSAPYKRPPSVATTTLTTSDGTSFNSNSSSGSLRSMRSLRHVTGRRITSRSRENSDSDNMEGSPRTNEPRFRTGRLERELSGLRRKLDSCVAEATARW